MFQHGFIKFKKHRRYYPFSLNPEPVGSLVYPVETKWNETTGFYIFKQSQRFESTPDWLFKSYGKLWNYHLQYLEILLDDNLAYEIRKQWLQDLSLKLLEGTLPMEPYPASLRIIYSLQFLSKHPTTEPIILTALLTQISFLEDHLEKHLSGNHLLENYQSLVYAHLALRHSDKLLYFLECLIKELDAQILDDGAHYELCLSYHAGIFCRLSGIIQLLRNLGRHCSELVILEKKASKMYSWMNAITKGFRVFPLTNDSVEWPAENWKKVQNLANEMKLDQEELLLSESAYRWFDNGSFQLLMRIGPFRSVHQPGHQHADFLNICLYFDGKPILIDPGISTYEAGTERLKQKGSSMHNLVVAQLNENQSELWSSFRMGRRAKVNCSNDSSERLEAYVRWYQGHIHRRMLEKVPDGLQVVDSFEHAGGKDQMAIAIFHFDWAVGEIRQVGDQIQLAETGISLQFIGAQSICKESYLQHFGFNDSRKAERILVYFCGHLQTKMSWKP